MAAGEPKIVHDHGSQFLSAEWRSLVESANVTDILTRVAHPESSGVVERAHTTHREEAFAESPDDYYHAVQIMTGHGAFYNNQRPHSALGNLCPVDSYRGDPEARHAKQQRKLEVATHRRRQYWTRGGS